MRSFVTCIALLAVASVGRAAPLPPSPYDILSSRDLETPLLDATPVCVPDDLDSAVDTILEEATAGRWREARTLLDDWRSSLPTPEPELALLSEILRGRAITERAELLEMERYFRARIAAGRGDPDDDLVCPRLELARILMLLDRASEAAAQLTRVERLLEDRSDPGHLAESVAFGRAEILYQRRQRFDAHLAFRELARTARPRLALAARLRLTDLSFEAGRKTGVDLEYEALLPRAAAFGASSSAWALRAAEASIDADQTARALQWIERFLEGEPSRDARDAAGIRLSDIDAALDDVRGARKRLATIAGRRQGDAIGALAAIRAIDLGVSDRSPDQRLEVLLRALREQREGVRRYALGVLMKERSERGDLTGALAAATRLAYEGVDPVVTPGYAALLDGILARLSNGARPPHTSEDRCRRLVRALGGRYGILIERASQPAAFGELGQCFERMELPWLAATVYRAIARRFGPSGAQTVALPLARSSLAIGEVPLARRVAMAALEDPEEPPEAWQAIVAEANFRDARFADAARGLRAIIDSPALAGERARLLWLLARTLDETASLADARLIAERAPAWLGASGLEPVGHAVLIESMMLAAHRLRGRGALDEAFALYRVLEREAAPGAIRSAARFWLGLARQPRETGESAWGENPDLELGTPWGRVARFERRFDDLRSAYASVRP